MPEIPSISYIRIGEVDHPIDAVTLNGQTLPDDSKYLPSVSSTEDGQMLGVETGEWTLFSPEDIYNDINGLPVGDDISGDSDSDTGDSDSDEPVHDYSLDYLTFEILGNGTIGWKNNGTGSAKTIQYSINDSTWTSITAGSDTINVSQGDVIRFKGTNTAYAIDKSNFSGFGNIGTATFNVSGNIMSLIYGDNFVNQTALSATNTFQSLFDHSNIVNAENLILPATTLKAHCYRAMFANCSLLRTAPALPATTMVDSCYRFMFQGCVLMTEAPDLPATRLITNCYYGMFSGASSLNYIRCLATNPSSTYTTSWTSGVASSGTFVKDINTQWDTNTVDSIPKGWTTVDEGTQIVEAPTIHCVNNIITFGCDTPNATIYYRFGGSGQYLIYDNPVEIYADTLVEVYASKNGSDSTVTSQTCIYVEPEIPGDSDSESEEGEHNYTYDYLTLDILTGGNLLWKANGTNATKTIQYSINDGEWTSVTSTTSGVSIPVSAGDSVRFKGTNTRYCEQNKANYSGFEAGSATFNISGNILSLIYGDNFIGQDIVNTWSFTQFFKYSKPVSAENMILLASSVPNSGYRAMFSKCSTLLVAPKELPATTLGPNAYYYMFEDCAITKAPVLPAASRSSACYQYMFNNCNNLNYIKCLDANPQSGYYTGWTTNVSPVGTFVKADNVSWTTGVNGIPTTWTQVNVSDEEEMSGESEEIEEYEGSDAPVLLGWKYAGNDITLPYSVNAINGHTNSYSKGQYVFNSRLALDELNPTYLWFNQASQSADIYIDNQKVGTHWGGYNSFSMDITNYVHTGLNDVMVILNNTTRNTLAPAAGDFNYNATLGEVKLLSSPVVPDPSYGYDGFHISATVTSASAAVTITTSVPNTATVVLTIDDGTYHYTDTSTGTGTITFTHTITNPHLWNGRLDPHLYDITLEFYHDGTLYHTFTRPYGFRYFSYVYNETVNGETYTGFLLNGQPYLLRGVCMHQDIEGKANALTYTDIQNDFQIINELNCNFTRTAHYPHPKEFYDLCDYYGVIVQTEVPWVNKAQSSMPSDYYTHLEGQYRDMVNEHYNHPSIIFWGLANEISTDDASFANTKINNFVSIIRSIDTSRWIGYVVSHSYPNGLGTFNYPNVDWIGQNLYVGWYLDKTSNNPSSRLNTCLNNANSRNTPMAYSEYGCGGNILCHSDDPSSTTTTGNNPRHDIEFQMWLHEGHIQCIKNYPQLLFTAQWVLFDFAVSSRNEGYITCLDGVTEGPNDDTNRYLNDKGLVKRDHQTKKDTFYLYKAWWNQTDKFVHICQKNYQKYADRVIKCYTNETGSLSLYVNNTLIETKAITNYIAEFTARDFYKNDVIRVTGSNSNDTLTMTNAPLGNVITVTSTTNTITATAASNVASAITITLTGDLSDTITISSGQSTGTLNVTPSFTSRTCSLSISPTSDSTYGYSLSTNSVTIPALQLQTNTITVTSTSDMITVTSSSTVTSNVTVTLTGDLSTTVTISSGNTTGITSISTSTSTRTCNLSVSPSSDSTYNYVLSSDSIIIPAIQVNTITITALPGGITTTASSNVTSNVTITLTGDISDTITIVSGQTTGILNVTPTNTNRICDLSISPVSDSSYNYVLSSNSITVPSNINNITVTSINPYVITATAANSVTSAITITLTGDISDTITISSGQTTGTLNITPSSTSRTCSLSVSPTSDSNYNYVLSSNTVIVLEKTYETSYLTIVSTSDNNTIGWKASNSNLTKTISISTDNGLTWTNKTSSTSGEILTTLNTGDKMLIKGSNTFYGNADGNYNCFKSTGTFNVEGNIMSMIYGDNFCGQTTLSSTYTFYHLFEYTNIVNAGNLILPATTLSQYCYSYMFSYCSSLTTAPVLPATTLEYHCYSYMFQGCSSLTTAPVLPATTLAGCCYSRMFYDCSNLNNITCLATNISAHSCTSQWLVFVASSGTFIKNPNMSSWSTGINGIPYDWDIQDYQA